MYDEPLAFFITFTTYGTRLHGDERGSVDRDHNEYGMPHVRPDEFRQLKREADLSQSALKLDAKLRGAAAFAIRDHCKKRGWELHALNVRTNHIHLVVRCNVAPDRALTEFKAYATREMRKGGAIAKDRKVWTRGGSKRWLWKAKHVQRACWYTEHAQGPELPKDWRDSESEPRPPGSGVGG
jgi:REP element-mobilizing transposase RayT